MIDYIAETIAQAFHETYERLAPEYGYQTREASAKPWADVPERNRKLMIATVADLLDRRVIMPVVMMTDEAPERPKDPR